MKTFEFIFTEGATVKQTSVDFDGDVRTAKFYENGKPMETFYRKDELFEIVKELCNFFDIELKDGFD